MRKVLQPEISEEAQERLAGDLKVINEQVMRLCAEQARTMGMTIQRLKLSVKQGWEEEFNELVLQVFVAADLPPSLALWDAIGDEVQLWGKKQSPTRRRLFEEQYAVFVEPLK